MLKQPDGKISQRTYLERVQASESLLRRHVTSQNMQKLLRRLIWKGHKGLYRMLPSFYKALLCNTISEPYIQFGKESVKYHVPSVVM